MLLATAFFLLVTGTGFTVLRLLGMQRGILALGLAPPAGLALLAVLTGWSAVLGLPPVADSMLLMSVSLAGLVLLAGQRQEILRAVARPNGHRLPLVLLAAALAAMWYILGTALGTAAVPLSSHDGAHHVEMIEALRDGARWEVWYPAGFHRPVAAYLQLTPWIDSAEGAQGTSLALALLGVLAGFGLGYAVFRNALIGAAGALLLTLTFQYPYHAHFWSGWPLAAGMVLVLGLWVVALRYLENPNARCAALGSLLVAGILFTHGTEVYTAAVGLLIIAAARHRRIAWTLLGRDLSLALGASLVLAAPYLFTVLQWAQSGGAVAAGYESLDLTSARAAGSLTRDLVLTGFNAASAAVLVDLPVRIALLLVGTWWVFHERTGRILVALLAAFLGLVLVFTYVQTPGVQYVFALTFPWAQSYRLAMAVAVFTSLLQAAGFVAIVHSLRRLLELKANSLKQPHLLVPRHAARMFWAVGLFLVIASVQLMSLRLAVEAQYYLTYSPDDAAAMEWLREHARPGEVLANDGAADAGIWAPYKAEVPVLMPRLGSSDSLSSRRLVLANLAGLDSDPEVGAAACALGLGYIYTGATGTSYERRRFPPLAELRRSASLEEVFTSGEASIFRVRLKCSEHATAGPVQRPDL